MSCDIYTLCMGVCGVLLLMKGTFTIGIILFIIHSESFQFVSNWVDMYRTLMLFGMPIPRFDRRRKYSAILHRSHLQRGFDQKRTQWLLNKAFRVTLLRRGVMFSLVCLYLYSHICIKRNQVELIHYN